MARIPTKGIGKKYWKAWLSGCFLSIFRVFSGYFQGVLRVFFAMPYPGMPFSGRPRTTLGFSPPLDARELLTNYGEVRTHRVVRLTSGTSSFFWGCAWGTSMYPLHLSGAESAILNRESGGSESWKGAKGIPTKGIGKKYFRVFSGCFSPCPFRVCPLDPSKSRKRRHPSVRLPKIEGTW